MTNTLKSYKLSEISTHDKESDLWIILDDKIYNVTEFRLEHPGGQEPIMQLAGKDATTTFEEVGHSQLAKDLAVEYIVGKVDEEDLGLIQSEGHA